MTPDTQPAHAAPLKQCETIAEGANPPFTLAAIDRALQTATAARNAADQAAVEADSRSREFRQHNTAMDVLQRRHDALRALAMTLQPASVEDAAVQIGAAIAEAYDLAITDELPPGLVDHVNAVLRTLLGVFPVMVKAAGRDMQSFAWVEFDNLAPVQMAGVAS
jgi:hypothetical protein